MSGGVYDVDFDVFIMDGSVFGENGNAALAFDVVGIHDAVNDLLVFPEDTALLEQLIHQCRFAVIDVRDDGDVADIFSCLGHWFWFLSR